MTRLRIKLRVYPKYKTNHAHSLVISLTWLLCGWLVFEWVRTLQIGAQPSIRQRLPEETSFHYELQKTYLQIEREFVRNDLILYRFDFEDDCTFQDIEPLELHRKIVPRLQFPYANKTSLHPKLRVRFGTIDTESLVSQAVEEVVDRFVH